VTEPEIIVLGPEGGVFRPADPNDLPWALVAVDNPKEQLDWRALLAAPADGHFLAFHTYDDLVTWVADVAEQLATETQAADTGAEES
jgi:hypothetical protein